MLTAYFKPFIAPRHLNSAFVSHFFKLILPSLSGGFEVTSKCINKAFDGVYDFGNPLELDDLFSIFGEVYPKIKESSSPLDAIQHLMFTKLSPKLLKASIKDQLSLNEHTVLVNNTIADMLKSKNMDITVSNF